MSRSRSAAVRFDEAAPIFAALGEETRLRLVAKLCTEGPLSITRLSEGTGVTRQAITKAASLFAALGDEARLQIVSRLCNEGPLSIARLT